MNFDYSTLDALRQNHPAWRLLRSDHAPLVASFLHRIFTAHNVRVISQADLAEALKSAKDVPVDIEPKFAFPVME